MLGWKIPFRDITQDAINIYLAAQSNGLLN